MARRAVPRPDKGTYDLAHALLLDRTIRSWQLVLNGTPERPEGWYLRVSEVEQGPLTRSQMAAALRELPAPSEQALALVCVYPLTSSVDVDRVLALA